MTIKPCRKDFPLSASPAAASAPGGLYGVNDYKDNDNQNDPRKHPTDGYTGEDFIRSCLIHQRPRGLIAADGTDTLFLSRLLFRSGAKLRPLEAVGGLVGLLTAFTRMPVVFGAAYPVRSEAVLMLLRRGALLRCRRRGRGFRCGGRRGRGFGSLGGYRRFCGADSAGCDADD